jgi:hypothetical protein
MVRSENSGRSRILAPVRKKFDSFEENPKYFLSISIAFSMRVTCPAMFGTLICRGVEDEIEALTQQVMPIKCYSEKIRGTIQEDNLPVDEIATSGFLDELET